MSYAAAGGRRRVIVKKSYAHFDTKIRNRAPYLLDALFSRSVEKELHIVPPSEAEGDFSASESGTTSEEVRRRDAFARLFAKHDRWLYSYLVTLLGSTAHAEEVFQEVCVVLWREYETFELGTDFVRWVAVIAHNQVRKFRRQRKQVGFQLDEITFDLVAAEAVERVDLFDYRRDALRRCLTKLSASDRALVEECYQEHKVNFKATALRLGRPENTVYKALNRIRRVLYECINRALVSEGLL